MNQSVTKGTLYLSLSQLILILTGYIVHLFLGRTFGPALYGTYAVTIALTTVVNNFLIAGIPRATSKYISENTEGARNVLKSALTIQLTLSLFVFISYFMLAYPIGDILNDKDLSYFIKLSSIMIPFTAILYVITFGYFNGIRDYVKQSLISIIFYISRLFLILSLVFLGFSISGAILGFATSPIVALIVAVYLLKFPKDRLNNFRSWAIISFAAPITAQFVTMNFITRVDLLILKALIENSEFIGYYSAASVISKAPLFFLGALNLAIFPAISAKISQDDIIQTRRYIYESLRYLLILLVPVGVIVSLTSGRLVTLLFSVEYISANEPLTILIFGLIFFGFFAYFCNLISAGGRPKISMYLTFFILIINIILNPILILKLDMIGAALATTISLMIGSMISFAYIYNKYKVFISGKTFIKIITASAIMYPILQLNFGALFLFIQYLLAFLLYISFLFLFKELTKEDLTLAKRLF